MFSGYTHDSDEVWGNLSANGSFATDDRIGGLTSITYHISGDLTVKFGYKEFDKPTFYSAPLSAGLNSFSFPEDKGYPDVFTIENEGANSVTISDMTFYYSCSQQDEHVPVGDGVITREIESGVVKYYQHDQIDTSLKMEVDLHSYQIKIGTSSDDVVTYDPYNYAEYSTYGSLEFDYAGEKRFILNLSGNHSSGNLYINSDGVTDSSKAQIYVNSASGTKIHDMTFKGGYGVLLFTGEKLTFVNGNLNTEAMYTTVRSPLSFEDTRKTKDGITISNGALVLEGGSDINVTGYNVGIRLGRSLTGTKDLNQSGGSVNISNCDIAVASNTGAYGSGEYKGTISVKSDFKITSSRIGFLNCNLVVGSETKSGHLLVDVDTTKAGDGRAVGMQIDNSYTLNFVKGQAAFYASNGKANTSAIKITNGWKNGLLTVAESGFEYGFANLDRGFDGEPNPVYDNDYSNTNASTFFYCFDAGNFDLASYCGTKPSGTQLSGTDFNNKFGI